MPSALAGNSRRRKLPRTVVALGFVSLFMDVSSEMIHALLPVYLVGVIEGVAEATANVTKLFSGVVSDWIGRRKPLLLAGYALAALTKPVFPLATGAGALRALR